MRAVRAAIELQEELARLNAELQRDWGVQIAIRTGVNSGEVVAGDASGRPGARDRRRRERRGAPPAGRRRGETLIGEAHAAAGRGGRRGRAGRAARR